MRPLPEAMHGAEVTEPQRAACGDAHDEFTLCRACDVRADHDRSPDRDVFSRHASTVAADLPGVRLEKRNA